MTIKFKMEPGTYYVWVGGSCDYGRPERPSAGAYIIASSAGAQETFVTTDNNTTEFRMLLTVIIHALEILPPSSRIVILTNVSYLLNFDKETSPEMSNGDLIQKCREKKARHKSVSIRIVSFHKYTELQETHDMARKAMILKREAMSKSGRA